MTSVFTVKEDFGEGIWFECECGDNLRFNGLQGTKGWDLSSLSTGSCLPKNIPVIMSMSIPFIRNLTLLFSGMKEWGSFIYNIL